MILLAIDPGTACGWAVMAPERSPLYGTWDLRTKRHEGAGMRFLRLRRYLEEAIPGCDLVAYEEVRRHAGTSAAHVYGGIVAEIQATCEVLRVPYTAVPVGTVKKHATGKGNAGKPAMIRAAESRWGLEGLTDDQADALWIADFAMGEWSQGRWC